MNVLSPPARTHMSNDRHNSIPFLRRIFPHWMFEGGKRSARIVLYITSSVSAAILFFAGFVYEAEPDTDQLLSSGQFLAQTGAFEAAEKNLSMVLEREPRNLHAHLVLGLIAERRNRLDEAFRIYGKSLDLTDEAPIRRDVTLSMGDLKRRMGDFAAARAVADELESRIGHHPGIERLRAVVASDEGEIETALAHVESLLVMDPANREGLQMRIRLLIAAGRLDDAQSRIEEFDAKDRSKPALLNELAKARVGSNDLAGAEVALEKMIEIDAKAKEKLRKDTFWQTHDQIDAIRSLLE